MESPYPPHIGSFPSASILYIKKHTVPAYRRLGRNRKRCRGKKLSFLKTRLMWDVSRVVSEEQIIGILKRMCCKYEFRQKSKRLVSAIVTPQLVAMRQGGQRICLQRQNVARRRYRDI